MAGVLGIDIGGANIKTAHNGTAKTHPFEVWKNPEGLASELARVLQGVPAFDHLAVTMTAELCDCYATKREGVAAILRAVRTAAPDARISTWSTAGQFVDAETALKEHLAVASANWHALATFVGRFPEGTALLIDVGSTTTDIIPIAAGKPTPKGLKDYDRRQTSELLYTGVRRTPVCALLGPLVLAEVFATSLDAFLITGEIPEEPGNKLTADGRPATREAAHARLARMLGADGETCSKDETQKLAAKVVAKQEEIMYSAIRRVASTLPGLPTTVILSGSGEFLGARVAKKALASAQVISLSEKLGPEVSKAACAHAVSVLAQELSSGSGFQS